jgi:GDPmannose 4,6-dehydratase
VRSALITGITGQDGGYLAEQLRAEGTQVHGLVRPDEHVPEHLQGVVVHEAELTDEQALQRVLQVAEPDEVYNLAGVSSVGLSWEQPALTAEVNGTFVARLLQLVWLEQERRGSTVAVVQASSAEIFAGAERSPQDESTPLSPRSPYGASKAFAHHLVQVFRARGLHASNAVLYNHESPRRPPTFVTRKITQTVAAISQSRAHELVLGNLDAKRDWGWAPEYVDALLRMVRHREPDDYVIATGQSRTVRDFVAAAFARAGVADWEPLVRSDPAFIRPVDAVELVGDASKARAALGWTPQVAFEELVGRMVDVDLQGPDRLVRALRPGQPT